MSADHDRRQFLKLLSSGGAGGLLRGCAVPEASAFFKDTAPFIPHGTSNLEARLEDMGGFLTPADAFFVRNNDRSLDIKTEEYRLVLEETPLRRRCV